MITLFMNVRCLLAPPFHVTALIYSPVSAVTILSFFISMFSCSWSLELVRIK